MSINISTCCCLILAGRPWYLLFSCRQQLSFIMTSESSLKPPTVQIHISFSYLGASVIGFEFVYTLQFPYISVCSATHSDCLNRYICLTNLYPLFSLCIQHLTIPLCWYNFLCRLWRPTKNMMSIFPAWKINVAGIAACSTSGFTWLIPLLIPTVRVLYTATSSIGLRNVTQLGGMSYVTSSRNHHRQLPTPILHPTRSFLQDPPRIPHTGRRNGNDYHETHHMCPSSSSPRTTHPLCIPVTAVLRNSTMTRVSQETRRNPNVTK